MIYTLIIVLEPWDHILGEQDKLPPKELEEDSDALEWNWAPNIEIMLFWDEVTFNSHVINRYEQNVFFFQTIFSIKKSDQDFEILEEKIELLWTWTKKFKGHFAFLSKYEIFTSTKLATLDY